MAAKSKQALDALEVNSSSGSHLIGCTVQHFNQLVRDGWIKPLDKNLYRLIDVVHGHKAYLQDEGRRTSKSAEASRVQA